MQLRDRPGLGFRFGGTDVPATITFDLELGLVSFVLARRVIDRASVRSLDGPSVGVELSAPEVFDGQIGRFQLRLVTDDVQASTTVWNAYDDSFGRLLDLFETMGADWKGWEGARSWESGEPGLAIPSVTNDGIAHVVLDIELSDVTSEWLARARLRFDLGALGEIARDLRTFLGR